MRCFAIVAALLALVNAAFAKLCFEGRTDKDALSYRAGETMNFDIALLENGKPVEGVKLKWFVRSDDGSPERSGDAVSAKTPLRISAKCNVAGFVNVRVEALDENGEALKKPSGNGAHILSFEGGAGADVRNIKTLQKEPVDFDAFWQRQISALAKIPLKADITPLPEFSKNGFDVCALSISCVGKPAKAFLSVPKNAKDKSLPLKVVLFGYGVDRRVPISKKGEITLAVERHSYELLREPEYYAKLKEGELFRFGIDAAKNKNPEDCYFKFMILRDLRAIEYAKKNVPQWNGRDLEITGQSMGGFQTIFVAWLDKDTTLCAPHMPWLTDLWGVRWDANRIPSTTSAQWTPSMGYFESNFAMRRVKCPVKITSWLGDQTCPPNGVMQLFNNASCPALIRFGQNGKHIGKLPPVSAAELKKNSTEREK